MKRHILSKVLTVLSILALATVSYAQEAALNGRIADSSGGVLPGVTVTATNEATGNTFVAVTDEVGAYRIPVRVGRYTLTVELPGFSTITRSGVELLVGQQLTVNLEMAPSTVQETVTVTGEAPLIETTQSTLGGNIDPRQLSELPVNGRNWMDLVLLAPGSRSNSVGQATAIRRQSACSVSLARRWPSRRTTRIPVVATKRTT